MCIRDSSKMMARELLNDDLFMQDIPFDIKPYSMHLYWHEHSEEDAALSWLRDTIVEIAHTEVQGKPRKALEKIKKTS